MHIPAYPDIHISTHPHTHILTHAHSLTHTHTYLYSGTLGAGHMAGVQSLLLKHSCATTVCTRGSCELLVLDRARFDECLLRHFFGVVMERVLVLRSLPAFHSVARKRLGVMSLFTRQRSFQRGEVLFTQGRRMYMCMCM